MTIRRWNLVLLVGLAFVFGAQAQTSRQASPRAADAPERARAATPTVPAVPVESVSKDLQKIIVLCATEGPSEKFLREWARYVEQHGVKAADLDVLIDDVLARAEAYRRELPERSRVNRAALIITDAPPRMRDTAMAVIRKIGG